MEGARAGPNSSPYAGVSRIRFDGSLGMPSLSDAIGTPSKYYFDGNPGCVPPGMKRV
jgi:hypothetical protein